MKKTVRREKQEKNYFIDPYTYNYPQLDCHGFDGDYTIFKLNEFIIDNLKLKNYTIVVVHGISGGILRKRIHEYIKKDKRVEKYLIDPNNVGQTIIYLKRVLN